MEGEKGNDKILLKSNFARLDSLRLALILAYGSSTTDKDDAEG